jgi:hypothetical protein
MISKTKFDRNRKVFDKEYVQISPHWQAVENLQFNAWVIHFISWIYFLYIRTAVNSGIRPSSSLCYASFSVPIQVSEAKHCWFHLQFCIIWLLYYSVVLLGISSGLRTIIELQLAVNFPWLKCFWLPTTHLFCFDCLKSAHKLQDII